MHQAPNTSIEKKKFSNLSSDQVSSIFWWTAVVLLEANLQEKVQMIEIFIRKKREKKREKSKDPDSYSCIR